MASKRYTTEQLIENASKVTSMGGLLASLGLRPAGGNYANMKRKLAQLAVDTSHWVDDHTTELSKSMNWSDYKSPAAIKNNLIKLRGNQCESCRLLKWDNSVIPLELHHIDGNRTNNDEDNLKLLCPNCHAVTDNWRGRKNK